MSIDHCGRRVLTTQEFWEAMCDPRFNRLSFHVGLLGIDQVYCQEPPDAVPGFIADRIAECRAKLG